MRSVGLKILKNKLSEYVRLAASGETILVTQRDRVVAELIPPRPSRSPVLADARLVGGGEERVDNAPTDGPGTAPSEVAGDDHRSSSERTGSRSKREMIQRDCWRN